MHKLGSYISRLAGYIRRHARASKYSAVFSSGAYAYVRPSSVRRYAPVIGMFVMVLMASLAFAPAAFADTETLLPDGDSSAGWTYVGGSTNFTNLQTNDGDTSYANSGTSNNTNHTLTFANPVSIGGSDTINSVTLHIVVKSTGAAEDLEHMLTIGGTDYLSATEFDTTGSYVDYPFTWNQNPDTSAAWTLTDLNNLIGGIETDAMATAQWATQVYIVVDYTPAVAPTEITIGQGTDPVAAPTYCPADATWRDLDHFTLALDQGSDTVNAVEVALGAGDGAGISSIRIVDDATVTQQCINAAPSGDTIAISGCSIAVNNSATEYRVQIQAKSTNAAPPGASYAITGNLTNNITLATNNGITKTDSDTASDTITVDDLEPSNTNSSFSVTAGDGQNTLNWTAGGGETVIIVNSTTATPTDPTEGTSYAHNDPVGSDKVVYTGADTGSGDIDSPLANGTAIYYELRTVDACNNYSSTVLSANGTPSTGPQDEVTIADATAVASGSVNAGDNDIQMMYYSLQVTTENDDSVATLDQVQVGDLGTAPATDVGNIEVWISSNASCCGGDTQIGTGTYTGNPVTINVTDQTITTTKQYIFIRYDIAGGAGDANTLQTNIADETYVILSSSDTLAAFGGASSNSISIIGAPVCTRTDPSITVQAPTSQTITSDGGTVNYTVRVTNNDTVACANETFDLTLTDSNSTNYLASQLNAGAPPLQIVVAPQAFQDVTLTVRAQVGETSGTNTTEVTVDDPNGSNTHAAVATTTDAVTDISIVACDKTITSCSECHGTAGGNWAPPDGPTRSAALGNVVGDHDVSSHVPSNAEATCSQCHEVPGGNQTHRDGDINMAVDAGAGDINATGYYDRDGDSLDESTDQTFAQTTSGTPGTGVCRNTYCHGGSGTASPVWGSGTTNCGSCHADDGGSGTPLAAGHAAHVNTTSAASSSSFTATNDSTASEHVFSCGTCHNDGSDGAGKHTDGNNAGLISNEGFTADISFKVAWAPTAAGTGGTYTDGGLTNALDPNGFYYYTDSTCNVYCHSNVQDPTDGIGAPTSYGSPTWGGSVSCGDCHLNPSASGAHSKHAGGGAGEQSYSCTECHFGWVFNGVNHVDGTLNVDVNNNNDGVSGTANYTQGDHEPGQGGFGTCTNVYCHGDWTGSGGPGSPAWNAGALPDCNACHNGEDENPPTTNAHAKHAGAGASGYLSVACQVCHNGGTAITTGHQNDVVNWSLDTTDTRLKSSSQVTDPTYSAATAGNSGAKAPTSNPGACANVWCHSSVQTDGGTDNSATYVSPDWNGDVGLIDCTSCHNYTIASGSPMATGSHTNHLSFGLTCSDCHDGAGGGTTNHANYNINVIINTTIHGTSAAYNDATNVPGDGYDRCNNTNCHGTTSPNWEISGASTFEDSDHCTICHGTVQNSTADMASTESQMAPPEDLSDNATNFTGNVGAHQAHLTTPHNYSDDITCNQCHEDYTLGGAGGVSNANHIDETGNQIEAELTWGSLATTGGMSPSYVFATQTCSTNYCHAGKTTGFAGDEGNQAPTWNDDTYLDDAGGLDDNDGTGRCEQCHGAPPNTGDHASTYSVDTTGTDNCGSCHDHWTSGADEASSGWNNASLHINGTLDASGGTCTGCHATQKNSAFVSDLDAQTGDNTDGVRIIVADFSKNSHHVTPDGAVTDANCVQCHCEGDTADPSAGQRNLTYHNDTIGTWNGSVDLRDADNASTCYETSRTAAGQWEMDKFCMSCHDGDATAVYTWSGSADNTNPFNDTLTNNYDQVARAGVLDVESQFNPGSKTWTDGVGSLGGWDGTTYNGNASQHAVRGPRYGSANMSSNSRMDNEANAGFTSLSGQSPTDEMQVHCGDCHTNGDPEIGAHGSANEYLLRIYNNGADALHGFDTLVCYNCHTLTTFQSTSADTHGPANGSDYTAHYGAIGVLRYGALKTGSWDKGNNGNIAGYACANCHNSGATGWGGIHGGNTQYTDGGSTTRNPYRFMPGMNNSHFDPVNWTSGNSITCYTIPTTDTTDPYTGWGSCAQHGSGVTRTNRGPNRNLTY